ncbi:VacJ family lipoprotein [Nitrincola tibetensis]|uniref:VacJ family lipoprotein n=1 Tax=Nitrincola tibetensis TaxID=2219697 RepID=A0A364NI83_9GAMM|nr:VacJ family lipoprotein [Nitrincola tibetensis]RAU16740.1 VacJ family lipoprotein [Nitrincola tibetensis]
MVSIFSKKLAVASLVTFVSIAPLQAQTESDPWEGFNRAMFSFNETIDRAAIKPLAQGYKFVTPELAQTGVSNFFDNLKGMRNFANNLLQGKVHNAFEDVARFTFNTTFGLVGLIDVATPMGIAKHDEDFGQTLGYWGMPSGPYVVLPFMGPSSVRDTVGMVPDWYLNPIVYIDDRATRNSLQALRLIDTRARLLEAERMISGDRYSFIRDSYLQRREFLVRDGDVRVSFDETDF